MFRFERKARVKHAADMPAAVQNAAEITAYLNKRYALGLKFGVEMFGGAIIHWYFDTESLDKSAQLDATLMQDAEYVGLVAKGRSLWMDGTLTDSIIKLVG